MKLFVVLCILALGLLAVSRTSGQSCPVPIYSNCLSRYGNIFFCSIDFGTTAAPNPDTALICGIGSGQPSCCSAQTYSQISTYWLVGKTVFQDSCDRLRYLRVNYNLFMDYINNLNNNLQKIYSQLNPAYATALETYFNTIGNVYGNLVQEVVGDWAQCAEGLLAYYAGLLCLGCNPNWSSTVVANPNGGYDLYFSETSCVALQGYCVDFLTDLVDFIEGIENAAVTLYNTLNNATISGYSLSFPFYDNCNGDCNEYICATFIAGVRYSSGIVDSQISGSSSKRSVSSSIEDSHHMSYITNHLNKLVPGSGDKLVDFHNEVKKHIESLHETKDLVQFPRASSSGSDGNANHYDSNSNRYDVVKTGQGSGLDNSINGAASLSSWISFLF